MNKENVKSGLIMLSIILLSMIVGFGINEIYRDLTLQRQYDGLWIKAQDKVKTLETAYNYEDNGDWVCVNVKGMSYERAVETCQHEAGHEIFAEIVEKNPEKIGKVMEVIER